MSDLSGGDFAAGSGAARGPADHWRGGFLERRGCRNGGGFASRLLESVNFISFLPCDIRLVLSEMAVIRRLGINWAKQVKLFDNRRGLEIENRADRAFDFFIADYASAEGVYAD